MISHFHPGPGFLIVGPMFLRDSPSQWHCLWFGGGWFGIPGSQIFNFGSLWRNLGIHKEVPPTRLRYLETYEHQDPKTEEGDEFSHFLKFQILLLDASAVKSDLP